MLSSPGKIKHEYGDPQVAQTLLALRRVGYATKYNNFGNGTLKLAEILNSNGWKRNNSKALGCPERHPSHFERKKHQPSKGEIGTRTRGALVPR